MTMIAAALERQRLTHRALRIEQVLAALRERRRERRLQGAVPQALDESIGDFTLQLSKVREHLDATEAA